MIQILNDKVFGPGSIPVSRRFFFVQPYSVVWTKNFFLFLLYYYFFAFINDF